MWLLLIACATPPPEDKQDTDSVVDTDTVVDSEETADSEPTDTDPDTGLAWAEPIEIVLIEAPDTVPEGEAVVIRFQTTGRWDVSELDITLTSSVAGALPAPTWDASAGAWTWRSSSLVAGAHDLDLDVTAPDGSSDHLDLSVGVCRWPPMERFDTDVVGGGWTTFGAARWDAGGWLEITGNETWRSGSIYKTSQKVSPGNVRLVFRFATGGGVGSGADGYAVNVIDVPDAAALATAVASADDGGCLGFGTAAPCGSSPTNSFHVEIDTWFNENTPITDPTPNNHIGIMLDGDAGNHVLWSSVASLEDLVWRELDVQTISSRIIVKLDGVVIIDGDIPGFVFDGGYIGVSGSTGAATNFHRFDDLQIFDRCLVPE